MTTRDEAIAALTSPGAPYELVDVDVDVDGSAVRWFAGAPPTLRDLYSDARSDAEFFVYDDERSTYEQAWTRAASIAHALIDDYGVASGDRRTREQGTGWLGRTESSRDSQYKSGWLARAP